VAETVGGAIASGVKTVYCWLADCEEEKAPGPPPPCQPNVVYASTAALQQACVCPAPMAIQAYYSQQASGVICGPCNELAGLDPFGKCAACPLGYHNDPVTNKCTVPISCPSDQRLKADNSGCYACPAGQTFNDKNSGCKTDCTGKEPLVYKATQFGPGVCTCPSENQLFIDGKCVKKASCDKSQGLELDFFTNTCVPICNEDEFITKTTQIAIDKLGKPVDAGKWLCEKCSGGQVGAGNRCVIACDDDAVRTSDSTCQTCPEGTERDGNSCVPICGPGSVFAGKIGSGGAARVSLIGLGGQSSPYVRTTPSYSKNPNAPGALLGYDGQVICKPCGENERSVSHTTAGDGYTITTMQCVACERGAVSKPGSDKCESPWHFNVSRFGRPSVGGRGETEPKPGSRTTVKLDTNPTVNRKPDADAARKATTTGPRIKNEKAEDPLAPHIRQPKRAGPVEGDKPKSKSLAPSLDDIGTGVSVGSQAPGAKGGFQGTSGPSMSPGLRGYSGPGGKP
jgi:hypothetical protein